MAKQFGNFERNLVRKEKLPATPKTEDEVRPFLATLNRKNYEARTGQEMAPKAFQIWFVNTAVSLNLQTHTGNTPLENEKTAGNQSIPGDKESGERPVYVENIPQDELKYKLQYVFPERGKVAANLLPDLVFVSGGLGYIDNDIPRPLGTSIAKTLLQSETEPIRNIRTAADSALYIPEIEHGDPIKDGYAQQFLSSDILGETHDKNVFSGKELSDTTILENICSVLFNEEADWNIAVKAFDEYARTGDDSLLNKIITPGRIKRAVEFESKFSPKGFTRSLAWREKNPKYLPVFKNEEDAIAYHKSTIETTRALTQGLVPEELHQQLFETLKKLIDANKENYLNAVEFEDSERRLLQPLIVATGPSELFLQASLDAGADAVLKEATPADIQQLIALANRIRTSPASISADRLRRNKSEFYRSVVNQIEDRSRQTADTAQELSILKSILEKTNAKKVLDVGSGYGRLMIPLAQSGYDVTGLESNRQLTHKARESAEGNRRVHLKKGDLIEYGNEVERGAYDAIYYGWHSFLEAYGLGNALATLRSARMALKPGGTVTFDQPSRENAGLEDGWYGDEEHGYLAYLMDEDELHFMLRLAGFEKTEIIHWTTKPTELYPHGMKKITVTAHKPVFGLAENVQEKSPQ